ncbi:MAG: MerC domain-containing protein, partial [Rhodanobacter sp.]
MDPQPANTSLWHAADRVGATASFLCAVHCAALPFVLALLPFVGLGFLADHRFERGFVLFACVLGGIALA